MTCSEPVRSRTGTDFVWQAGSGAAPRPGPGGPRPIRPACLPAPPPSGIPRVGGCDLVPPVAMNCRGTPNAARPRAKLSAAHTFWRIAARQAASIGPNEVWVPGNNQDRPFISLPFWLPAFRRMSGPAMQTLRPADRIHRGASVCPGRVGKLPVRDGLAVGVQFARGRAGGDYATERSHQIRGNCFSPHHVSSLVHWG